MLVGERSGLVIMRVRIAVEHGENLIVGMRLKAGAGYTIVGYTWLRVLGWFSIRTFSGCVLYCAAQSKLGRAVL